MTTDRDDIIVFRKFDTVIAANIAKTKLDAYGIPSFLTEENISNLYPGQPFLTFTVRLHLFAKDEEKAREVLIEELIEDTEGALHCPKCNSIRITREFPNESGESLTLLFFGVLLPGRKVNHCLDCEHEF